MKINMKNCVNTSVICGLLIGLFAGLPAALAEDEKAPVDLGRNAALIYWQAFDQYDAAQKDEAFAKAVSEYDTVAIDAKLRGMLKESTALGLMRLAAEVEPCDWGIALLAKKQGPMTLLPHLSRVRQLARLGLLSARANLEQKNDDAALEDVTAVYRIARHSQAGNLLISQLVGIAIDSMAHQFVGEHLDQFTAISLGKLRDRMNQLPALAHVSTSVVGERDTFGLWFREQVLKFQDRSIKDKLKALAGGDETARMLMQFGLKPNEVVLKMVDEMIGMYEPLAKLLELPPDEFDPAYAKYEKKIKDSNNTLAKALFPAYGRVHETYHRSQAMTAILKAVLVLRLDGQAAFDAIKDPYADGKSPFTITKVEDGIVVSSKLAVKNGAKAELKVKWKPAQ